MLLILLLDFFFHRGFKHCETTREPGAQFALPKGREARETENRGCKLRWLTLIPKVLLRIEGTGFKSLPGSFCVPLTPIPFVLPSYLPSHQGCFALGSALPCQIFQEGRGDGEGRGVNRWGCATHRPSRGPQRHPEQAPSPTLAGISGASF